MTRLTRFCLALILAVHSYPVQAQEGLVPAFEIPENRLNLVRLARPGTPFDKVGRKFAVLADESGAFEAWAYPLKLFRNFEISFLVGSSTRPIKAADIVRRIKVTPETTTLTFSYQSFTVKAIYFTPIDSAGAVILLDIDSNVPLTIICGFLPSLQPMWPAGLGGQYAYWNDASKAYILSESSGKNHGLVGSPAAEGISYTPAHMLSDVPNEFRILIPDPERIRNFFIPIYMAGGMGKSEDIKKIYESLQSPQELLEKTALHYRKLLGNTLRLHTPDAKLDAALEWAKISFDNLLVDNPRLGLGMVAGLGASGTSGRPGFGWFFGGDSFINSFSLLALGEFDTVREILLFNRKWQRDDGKIAHELSQADGFVDWWNDYHYGYIHGDTTPYYIAAVYEYYLATGDKDFINKIWNSLEKAFDWCMSTDSNGDGLMDNRKAGLGALEYGALTGIETDIYLGSVWVRAAYAMSELAKAAGKKTLAERAVKIFEKSLTSFRDRFWDEESSFYAYAFNSEGRRVKEISPWSAIGLMWGLGEPQKSLAALYRLGSWELTTDWGIRSISRNSRYFQPLNYNYGAVWPFITSWVTAAQFRHHLGVQGYSTLMSTVRHTYDNSLGNLTEVFSGTHYAWPQEAVSHQGFSTAGVVLPALKGLSGLSGDASEKTIVFAPQFPAEWNHVAVENFRIGDAVIHFDYRRDDGSVIIAVKGENFSGYRIRLAPCLGPGTEIFSADVDGQPVDFRLNIFSQAVQPDVTVSLSDKPVKTAFAFHPTVEILPFIPETHVGDPDQGLKIIEIVHREKMLNVRIEGMAGKRYELRVTNEEMIESVEGADLVEDHLQITMPEEKKGLFVPHTVSIKIAETEAKYSIEMP